MESKVVGVVIPIFNTEANLLKKCIDSVLAQTYKNLEICLVNDGSTQEEVLEICKKYCRSDVRITLIHKQYNGGVSELRNAAIEWFSVGGGAFFILLGIQKQENPFTLLTHKVRIPIKLQAFIRRKSFSKVAM